MNTAPHKKLEIYLDSSDFSTLSNPKSLTPAFSKILDQLKKFLDEGKINFRFSSVHIAEAASVDIVPNTAAEKRAELIWNLCGNNSVIHHMQMMKAEVKSDAVSVFSDVGQWYPPISDLLPKNIRALQQNAVTEFLREENLNRKQRRAITRQIHNKKGFTPQISKLLSSSSDETVNNIIKVFPFNDVEANLVAGFFKTGENRERTENTILRVLADHRWLVKRLASSPKDLEVISGWLRLQGASLIETMSTSISQLQLFRSDKVKNDIEFKSLLHGLSDPLLKSQLLNQKRSQNQKLEALYAARWKKNFLDGVNIITEKLAIEFCISHTPVITHSEAFEKYPGISTLVTVINHAYRSAMEINPRPMKQSDLGDAMHSIYAPYVHIFRADAFMTNPILLAVERYGTKVVGNLCDLPDAINDSINADLNC